MKKIITIIVVFLIGFFYNQLKYQSTYSISKFDTEEKSDFTPTNTNELVSKENDGIAYRNIKKIKKEYIKRSEREIFKIGESLYSKLKSKKINESEIYNITTEIKKNDKNKLNIKAGDTISFDYINNNLVSFSLYADDLTYTKIILGEEIIVYEDILPTEIKIEVAEGEITNSLYYDGLKFGLDDRLIAQLASIFAWDIDFAKEIYPNDKFYVVYEKIYSGNRFVKNGNILFTVFKTRKKDFYGIRFDDGNGYSYYNMEGKSLQKAFIRSPVKFPRITSKFTYKRFHPILKINRPHRGVDYGGRLNTPIMATGSGKVVYKGKKRAYGNHIIIDHGQGYKTLYAHLNKYNKEIKLNEYVEQSQIIGYMGKTGLATGVHLHYEFRINDAHKDPLTLKLPDGKAVKNKDVFDKEKNKFLDILKEKSEFEDGKQ